MVLQKRFGNDYFIMDEIHVTKYLGDIERYRKIFVIEDIYVIEEEKQDAFINTSAPGNTKSRIN